ncbi:MAG TPA: ZIP family metal transporter [Thermoclostridium sp.]|nr:ZIP family metal transporter [Thermoclostridium sp.]
MRIWFVSLDHVTQALLATLFTWAVTAFGAALVFLFKEINKKILNGMLGFAAGVMIAASFWSLLEPSIEMAEIAGVASWIPAAAGFVLGGIFLYIIDKLLPHMHLNQLEGTCEGIKTGWERSVLLVLAITIHNIPEGLAVGVAFGAIAADLPTASLAGAIALTAGIAIQNFPEGAAVSIPLRREGLSRFKSFMYGQASGMVEPVAGILGALLVTRMRVLLPYALSFAAGSMIYVVAEELIPEAQRDPENHISTIGVMLGFTIMMILDVALG